MKTLKRWAALVEQMSCFVGVHEASRNVVVHHPHLICRLLFPFSEFLCVLVYSVRHCGFDTGGFCWVVLRIK